jgi:hypothetical protein
MNGDFLGKGRMNWRQPMSISPALESNAPTYDVKMRMCHGNGNTLAQK